MAWAILVASGKAEKFTADTDTAFLTLGSRPIITYSLAAFEQCPEIEGVIVVAPKERIENVRVLTQMYGFSKVRSVVAGTTQRQSSVQAGLKSLEQGVDLVVLHDASRPCITHHQVTEVVKLAKKSGGAVIATKPSDPPKQVAKGNRVKESLSREDVLLAGYPQAYKLKPLLKGYAVAARKKLALEDDSEALALAGEVVTLIPVERPSIRVAGPLDLTLADAFLRS